MLQRSVTSPNEAHKLELIFKGEVRFGPAYFEIELDGQKVIGNAYGECWKWSSSSEYLAIQHWLTTAEGSGPNMQVALFDLGHMRVSFFSEFHGFVQDFVFEGNLFVYKKHNKGSGKIVEVEVSIPEIKNWQESAL